MLARKYPDDLEHEIKSYHEDLLNQTQKSSGQLCIISRKCPVVV